MWIRASPNHRKVMKPGHGRLIPLKLSSKPRDEFIERNAIFNICSRTTTAPPIPMNIFSFGAPLVQLREKFHPSWRWFRHFVGVFQTETRGETGWKKLFKHCFVERNTCWHRVQVALGGTDCSRPLIDAKKNDQKFDCFVVITDKETWHGVTKPSDALVQYREVPGDFLPIFY